MVGNVWIGAGRTADEVGYERVGGKCPSLVWAMTCMRKDGSTGDIYSEVMAI